MRRFSTILFRGGALIRHTLTHSRMHTTAIDHVAISVPRGARANEVQIARN
jgi:hypothetical protein